MVNKRWKWESAKGNTVRISTTKISYFFLCGLNLTSLPVFQSLISDRNWEISHREIRDKLWKLRKKKRAT